MVELPRGEVSESRRGGSGVLELLLVDMRNASRSGYIRCEAPRLSGAIGQITVHDGAPRLALYEGPDGDLKMGHVALGAIRESALHEDSRLSVHEGVDVRLIEELHPLALLHVEEGEAIAWSGGKSDDEWWAARQRRRPEWKRLDAWQSEKASPSLPDASERVSPLKIEVGDELIPGMVAVIDSEEPNEVIAVARHLGEIGHPLLILTRIPPSRMEIEHGIPAQVSRWLTEKGDDSQQVLAPSLEEVRRVVDDFLHSSQRCVIVLDGAEFLSGLHGTERLLGLLRSLVDTVTSADHLLLIPCDFSAWSLKERTIMLREVDRISSALVAEWALRPSIIEGHPFCADDWTPFVVPEADEQAASATDVSVASAASAIPAQQLGEIDVEANRFSISDLVEEWRQERSDEVAAAAAAADPSSSQTEGVSSTSQTEAATSSVAGSTAASVRDDGVGAVYDDDGRQTGKPPSEELPDWATSPSANMLEEEIRAQLERQSGMADEPTESALIGVDEIIGDEEDTVAEIVPESDPVVPKAATINHRKNTTRRVKKRRVRKSQLYNRELARAATLSGEVGEMATPAIDRTSRDELTSAAGLATEVVILPEEVEYRSMDAALSAAVKGAKVVRAEVPESDNIDLRQKGLVAAKDAAAGDGITSVAPPVSDNPSVRESASRAQRTARFTQWLAEQERSDLRAMSGAFAATSSEGDTVWQRIAALQSEGVDMSALIEMFDIDPETALNLLEEAER